MPTEKQESLVEKKEQTPKSSESSFDFSQDVILRDDDGDRIAAMREYVFLNLATSCN